MARFQARFGISTPNIFAPLNPEFGSLKTTVDSIRMADDLGFEAIMGVDHVLMPDYWTYMIGKEYHDPFTFLAFAAGMTKRIRLLFGAIVVPYRNPFTQAKAVASLDCLSNGRVIVGAAPGYLENEFAAFGVPHRERGAITDEYLQLWKALWTEERPTFRGKYVSVDGTGIWPQPVQKPHPPIWIAGTGPRAIRRTAELGDFWFPIAFPVVQDEGRRRWAKELEGHHIPGHVRIVDVRKGRERLEELARANGRPVPGIGIVAGMITVTDSPSGDRETSDRQSYDFLGTGSAEEIVEALNQWCAAGVSYFQIGFVGQDPTEYRRNAERFAREVMPAFQ